MGPSHGGIGALSKSINVSRISKLFALVLPSLATNQLNGNCSLGSGIQSDRHFYFSLRFDAATRLPFNVKEKQWSNETENGEPGHQNMFAH
jgi:hypothetical protein